MLERYFVADTATDPDVGALSTAAAAHAIHECKLAVFTPTNCTT